MPASSGSPAAVPARRVLLLLNPGTAQSGAMQHFQRRITGCEERPLELIVPDPRVQKSQFSHARAAVEDGIDAVVVCGGDGTVGAGVNLVAGRHTPLGIIPAGSGNDFARAAGIPRRGGAAMECVLRALRQPQLPVRAVDALRMRLSGSAGTEDQQRWAANSVNIGFDARVNQRANAQYRTPRRLRYLAALAQEVPRFSPAEFDVEFDSGEPQRLQSALLCIQNGSSIGGGIPLARHARIDDGWAEASHVGRLSRVGLVALFPLLMMRMHRWLRPLTTLRVRRLSVRVPARTPIYADGDELLSGAEPTGGPHQLEIEVVPAAVQLLG